MSKQITTMRTLNPEDQVQKTSAAMAGEKAQSQQQTFSTTLSSGRVVTVREMKGHDLVYVETDLSKYKETQQSFYLMERIGMEPHTISYEEIIELGVKDIKKISELVAKANGSDDEEQDPK